MHPLAVADEATTAMGRAVTVEVLDNDPAGAVLSATLAATPSHGLVQADPATGAVLYTPAPNYLGTDELTYRACAPSDPADCATAPVTIRVIPDNVPPLAPPLALETSVGVPVTGSPAVVDPDGDVATLVAAFSPVSGTAAVDPATGTTTYVPPPGFAGRDLYQYTVCDDGLPVLCATGLVTVLVDPVATNDQGTVLAPDVTGPPAHGTVVLVNGSLVYTPDPGFVGTETFVYRICAADVSPACDTATVTVVVTAAAPSVDPVDPQGGGSGSDGAAGQGGTRLPRTGGDSAGQVLLALALLVAGTGAVLARRLRRLHT